MKQQPKWDILLEEVNGALAPEVKLIDMAKAKLVMSSMKSDQ